MTNSLFTQNTIIIKKDINKNPLADLIRPESFKEYIGQKKLIGEKGILKNIIQKDELVSLILWGPPGCGKTTLARLIAKETKSHFISLSAVNAGKNDIRKVIKTAKEIYMNFNKKRTILFLDEIHRFNKAQQDFLLPFVENGTIVLIGATTENPSFEINSALLSRTRVFVLEALDIKDIEKIVKRALKILKKSYNLNVKITKETIDTIANLSNGDSRNALNILELAIKLAKKRNNSTIIIKKNDIKKATLAIPLYYDKKSEEHYNLISALHKSIRASNPDAGLYWLARIIEAGEDPIYIARRLLRFASEDIGNADIYAVILANNIFDSVKKIGLPECKVHLAQLVIYLAKAPKDNTAYIAYEEAKEDALKTLNLPVPLHLRNAPTKLLRDLGYSKGYIYDHDVKGKKSGQQCFPDKLKGKKYIN